MTACEVCGGACCKSIVFNASKFSASELEWVTFHGMAKDGKVRFPVPCQHLKDGLCTIYENRPHTCRVYPVGCKSCLEAVELYAGDKASEVKRLIGGHDGSR